MINPIEQEKEYIRETIEIIKKINYYHSLNKGFILMDLLKENESWNVYITKGILQTLVCFEYIEIFTCFGNGRYVYRCKKKIENNKIN